jgi:hypothetical protein
MDEPHKWGSSRYIVLFAVSTLHVALVIALIIFARSRILLSFAPNPIELLALPPSPAPKIRLPPPAPTDRPKKATPSAVPPAAAITIDPSAAPADEAGPPVNWAQEALSVAAGLAKEVSPERREGSALAPPVKSPFAPPPAHHKGEQYPSADGQWIVFVSEDCHQVSKSITTITNATNTGFGVQTYCTRHSKKPRGDLFDQLPAYQKLHAND